MRISIEEFALRHAEAASCRSEDPYLQVGAAVVNLENRVIATGYNGLPRGFVAPKDFWEDRDFRRSLMIHAEQNVVTLFHRGEGKLIAVTHSPCSSCTMLLIAAGITQIVYRQEYERDPLAVKIAQYYGIRYEKIS